MKTKTAIVIYIIGILIAIAGWYHQPFLWFGYFGFGVAAIMGLVFGWE